MSQLYASATSGSASSNRTDIPMSSAGNPVDVPSDTSPSPAYPPLPRPTSRRNDPNHPLTPRGIQTRATWQFLPHIQFYALHDESAENEFERVISPSLLALLREWGYPSYTVTFTHAGYSAGKTVPFVLVIAPMFKIEHAKLMVAEFDRLERHSVCELFCYEGDTGGYGIADQLQTYQSRPNCGSSIGPEFAIHGADPNTSSSLGFYLRLGDDDTIYATSVHHALGPNVNPIDVDSPPEISIQHPSFPDVASQIEQIESEIDAASNGESDVLVPTKTLQKVLQELKSLDNSFGVVVASGYGVVQIDGRNVSEDWLLIEVPAHKTGVNHVRAITFPPGPGRSFRELEWTPRDTYGIYVNGLDDLTKGMWVCKAGRSTGDTVGRVQFAYSHCKLTGNAVETREWTIVSSVFGDKPIFAKKGILGPQW